MKILRTNINFAYVDQIDIPDNLPFTPCDRPVLIGDMDGVEAELTKTGYTKHESPRGDLWLCPERGQAAWFPLGGDWNFAFCTFGAMCGISANWASKEVTLPPE